MVTSVVAAECLRVKKWANSNRRLEPKDKECYWISNKSNFKAAYKLNLNWKLTPCRIILTYSLCDWLCLLHLGGIFGEQTVRWQHIQQQEKVHISYLRRRFASEPNRRGKSRRNTVEKKEDKTYRRVELKISIWDLFWWRSTLSTVAQMLTYLLKSQKTD